MNKTIACIGTASVRGSQGMYTLEIDEAAGKLKQLSTAPSMNAGYVVLSPDKRYVYATQENMTFQGLPTGGVASYSLDENGGLTLLNKVPAGGQLPCHISIKPNGEEVYVSSYLKGCVSVHKILPDGSLAPYHKVMQLGYSHGIEPSVHCSVVTPDAKFLCSCNVTAHDIVFFELDSGEYHMVDCFEFGPPYNRRPRQIVFSAKHAYLLTESGKEICVLDYDITKKPFLTLRQVIRLNPDDSIQRSAAACVKLSPNGKLLACSVRQYDLIDTFAVGEDGLLSRQVFNKVSGHTPRDFNFTPDGKFLLVGGQQSDTMELYHIGEDGVLAPLETDFHLPSCFCVAF